MLEINRSSSPKFRGPDPPCPTRDLQEGCLVASFIYLADDKDDKLGDLPDTVHCDLMDVDC